LLLIILIVLALLFLGGGFGMRGHSSYGSYSTPGIGLGGILHGDPRSNSEIRRASRAAVEGG